jgi:hypothetical protein
MNLTEEQIKRVHSDVASKRRATEYLRLAPLRLPEQNSGAVAAERKLEIVAA